MVRFLDTYEDLDKDAPNIYKNFTFNYEDLYINFAKIISQLLEKGEPNGFLI